MTLKHFKPYENIFINHGKVCNFCLLARYFMNHWMDFNNLFKNKNWKYIDNKLAFVVNPFEYGQLILRNKKHYTSLNLSNIVKIWYVNLSQHIL